MPYSRVCLPPFVKNDSHEALEESRTVVLARKLLFQLFYLGITTIALTMNCMALYRTFKTAPGSLL